MCDFLVLSHDGFGPAVYSGHRELITVEVERAMTTVKPKTRKPATSKSKTVKAKGTGKKVVDEQQLTRLIEDIIEDGANTAEEINRAVLDLPVQVLVNLGLGKPAKEVKRIQDASIGAIYKLIHDINHQVADLASDLLKKRKAVKKK
jgi:phosphopentomutase